MPKFDFYFAGELFDAKHLTGNAYLAAEILKNSDEKFRPVLPQDLEQRSLHPQDIRDEDILALLQSDLALFHFDGTELDSGTVVEFMIAKFADIPSVILRTDFRASGDQEVDPWNLMVSFYPRTEVVVVDALKSYKFAEISGEKRNEDLLTDPSQAVARISKLNKMVATKVINAFERVLKIPPLLVDDQQDIVFDWMEKMCNFRRSKKEIKAILDRVQERRNEISNNLK